jgi:DUF438 domain-containing protein
MVDTSLMAALLDSLKDRVVFVDTDHMIRYMNKAAIAHYDDGAELIGRSVLDCHNENSKRQIIEIFAAMRAGLDERLITDNEKERIFMRAVRDPDGELIGYYERYEPPAK